MRTVPRTTGLMTDVEKLTDAILNGSDDAEVWAVLIDAVEELGAPISTWKDIIQEFADDKTVLRNGYEVSATEAFQLAVKHVFEGLGKASYPYAINLLQKLDLVRMQHIAVDGINSGKCGANWEADLRRDEAEWVLREQGNMETKPLQYHALSEAYPGRNEEESIVIDGQAYEVSAEHKHSLWLDSAPEWLESDLEEGEHLTLVTDGGGFQSELPEYILIPNKAGDELWKRVADHTHGAEVECPFKEWDDEAREDGRDRLVTLKETFCGESPGEECRYCGEKIGEEHGVIYIGEGALYVYTRVDEEEDEDEEEGE